MIFEYKQSFLGHNSAIYKLIDQKESGYFYSLAGDGMVVRWEKNGDENGRMMANAEEQIFCGLFLEDRNWLVMGGMNGNLVWLDLAAMKIIKIIKQHSRSIYGLCRVGESIFSVSGDGTLCKWNIESQLAVVSLQISVQGLRTVVLGPHNQLFIGGSDLYLYVIHSETLKITQKLKAHNSSIFTIAINENGQIYTGGRDALLNMWSLEDGTFELLKSIPAHMYTINDILLYNDLVITASRDKKIRIWTSDLTIIQSLDYKDEGHLNSVNSLIFDKELGLLFSAGDDRKINVWKSNMDKL